MTSVGEIYSLAKRAEGSWPRLSGDEVSRAAALVLPYDDVCYLAHVALAMALGPMPDLPRLPRRTKPIDDNNIHWIPSQFLWMSCATLSPVFCYVLEIVRTFRRVGIGQFTDTAAVFGGYLRHLYRTTLALISKLIPGFRCPADRPSLHFTPSSDDTPLGSTTVYRGAPLMQSGYLHLRRNHSTEPVRYFIGGVGRNHTARCAAALECAFDAFMRQLSSYAYLIGALAHLDANLPASPGPPTAVPMTV